MTLIYSQPTIDDAAAIHQLVSESNVLDTNSEYSYLLLSHHFDTTCCVVKDNGNVIAYVSAYLPPKIPSTLFVWQMIVHANYRGKKLAHNMIIDILKRAVCNNIDRIHTTVAASNHASRSVFKQIANTLETQLHEKDFLHSSHFSDQHEAEPLLVIGPFNHHQLGE
tara:strand:+ start:312 stop:809 length:498 start_codon:yes stop_codon:yes gene_type:complete